MENYNMIKFLSDLCEMNKDEFDKINIENCYVYISDLTKSVHSYIETKINNKNVNDLETYEKFIKVKLRKISITKDYSYYQIKILGYLIGLLELMQITFDKIFDEDKYKETLKHLYDCENGIIILNIINDNPYIKNKELCLRLRLTEKNLVSQIDKINIDDIIYYHDYQKNNNGSYLLSHYGKDVCNYYKMNKNIVFYRRDQDDKND